MKQYNVRLQYLITYEIEVEAKNEEQAERVALNDLKYADEVDTQYYDCESIKEV